jgi:hypothetical protein
VDKRISLCGDRRQKEHFLRTRFFPASCAGKPGLLVSRFCFLVFHSGTHPAAMDWRVAAAPGPNQALDPERAET